MIRPEDTEKWQRVFLTFDTGTLCQECPYHREWQESHPYQEGRAQETLRSCSLIGASREPERCPGAAEEEESCDE